ncbi:MAG: amidohydrolase [Betaproteobacteria bacterium]|nr:amidohydrolase [Betaproteobacteria bacterium]MBI3939130.1 amidohydrolase [Betaproteobacteria bacterium]
MIDREKMRVFDLHSHWGTRRGYRLRTDAERAQQPKVWKSTATYVTEQEMAGYFRKNRVKAILDFGFTKSLPIDEVKEFHDYALETQRKYPDAIFGNWINIDPRSGTAGVAEVERCVAAKAGFVGFMVSGGSLGVAASDPVFDPFYGLCREAKIPVLILVGYTGSGAGLPGGGGVRLELCHPRHVDDVAVRYPDLRIIAGRPAWPWQDEMIAVLLHKPNVWYELHGWSPKYHTESLKREISRRLKDRVMFGADYPLFTYERLFADWEAEGYSQEILGKVFCRNAESFFTGLGA